MAKRQLQIYITQANGRANRKITEVEVRLQATDTTQNQIVTAGWAKLRMDADASYVYPNTETNPTGRGQITLDTTSSFTNQTPYEIRWLNQEPLPFNIPDGNGAISLGVALRSSIDSGVTSTSQAAGIGKDFDTETTYQRGWIAYRNSKFYIANKATGPGSFRANDWQVIGSGGGVNSQVGSGIADPYDPEDTYVKGQFSTNGGNVYVAKVDIDTPEEFDATKWLQINNEALPSIPKATYVGTYKNDTTYFKGQIVDNSNIFYIANQDISTAENFNSSKWNRVDSTTTSISWNNVTDKPTIITSYNDLSDKPTIITSYNDLTDKPTIITKYSELSGLPTLAPIKELANTWSNGSYIYRTSSLSQAWNDVHVVTSTRTITVYAGSVTQATKINSILTEGADFRILSTTRSVNWGGRVSSFSRSGTNNRVFSIVLSKLTTTGTLVNGAAISLQITARFNADVLQSLIDSQSPADKSILHFASGNNDRRVKFTPLGTLLTQGMVYDEVSNILKKGEYIKITNNDTAKTTTISSDPKPSLVSKSANYTITIADACDTIRLTGTTARTFTLPDLATKDIGVYYVIMNNSTANLTLDGNGTDTVNGTATITLKPGEVTQVQATSTSTWYTMYKIEPPAASVNTKLHSATLASGLSSISNSSGGSLMASITISANTLLSANSSFIIDCWGVIGWLPSYSSTYPSNSSNRTGSTVRYRQGTGSWTNVYSNVYWYFESATRAQGSNALMTVAPAITGQTWTLSDTLTIEWRCQRYSGVAGMNAGAQLRVIELA